MTGEMTLGSKFLAIRGLKEHPFSAKRRVIYTVLILIKMI
jgi:ATP-dependent Lon protease